jgi:hypothetical protein
MKKLVNMVGGLVAAALLCVASVSRSYAAPTTAFVSGGGSDANPCTVALPCRNIFNAIAAAGNGGVVSCLDAGPYTEAFALSYSFTFDCRGVVYANGGTFAYYVSAPVVTFRNVIFDGAQGGVGAVQITGGRVIFENCTFQNFTASPGIGVQFAPASGGAHLTITDSVFTHNGTASGGGGILIQPSGGFNATAVIERTQIAANTYGIVAIGSGGPTLVEVRSSSVASNVGDGIWAYTGGSVTSIVVEDASATR